MDVFYISSSAREMTSAESQHERGGIMRRIKGIFTSWPQISAVLWGMLHCGIAHSDLWAEQAPAEGTASLFLTLGLRMSAAKNVCWQTCGFTSFMAQLCLSWGFLSAVVVVRHLCLHTYSTRREIWSKDQICGHQPQGLGSSESRAEPLFCPANFQKDSQTVLLFRNTFWVLLACYFLSQILHGNFL